MPLLGRWGLTLIGALLRTTQLYGSSSLLCSLSYTFRYIVVNACAFSKACMRNSTLARTLRNISAEGLHFSDSVTILECIELHVFRVASNR